MNFHRSLLVVVSIALAACAAQQTPAPTTPTSPVATATATSGHEETAEEAEARRQRIQTSEGLCVTRITGSVVERQPLTVTAEQPLDHTTTVRWQTQDHVMRAHGDVAELVRPGNPTIEEVAFCHNLALAEERGEQMPRQPLTAEERNLRIFARSLADNPVRVNTPPAATNHGNTRQPTATRPDPNNPFTSGARSVGPF